MVPEDRLQINARQQLLGALGDACHQIRQPKYDRKAGVEFFVSTLSNCFINLKTLLWRARLHSVL